MWREQPFDEKVIQIPGPDTLAGGGNSSGFVDEHRKVADKQDPDLLPLLKFADTETNRLGLEKCDFFSTELP